MFQWRVVDALQRRFTLSLNTTNQERFVEINYQHVNDEEHRRGLRFLKGMIDSSSGIRGYQLDHRGTTAVDLDFALMMLARAGQIFSYELIEGQLKAIAEEPDEWPTLM